MILGIGTDIVDIARIESAITEYGEAFLRRIFTPVEQAYCDSYAHGKMAHYAARFAVKEAFSKAIGTGITKGFAFKDVGIVNQKGGKPCIVLSGNMLDTWGAYTVHVSISHTDTVAMAIVIIESDNDSVPDITIQGNAQ
jgi:holo-[acyl-carrier protein] synthase